MSVFGLYFHAGSYNHGCEALVRTTSSLIKDTCKNSKINLYSFSPEEDKEFGVKNIDEMHKLFFTAVSVDVKKPSADWLKLAFLNKISKEKADAFYWSINCREKSLKENDVFLSIGGDNYCYSCDHQMYAMNEKIKKLKKELILWGCSIGKENLTDIKTADLRHFDTIVARESITYSNMLDIGIDKSKLRLHADPAFMLKSDELPLPDGFAPGNTVGLNISPMVIDFEKKEKKGIAMRSFEKIIEYILSDTDCSVALIPHVIKPTDNDIDALKKLYEKYKDSGRIVLFDGKLNAEQIKGYIARCRAFVGARTHSTIAAYSTCVPTLVLGYSVKSRGIARDIFGSEEGRVVPVNDLNDENTLLDAFKNLMKNEDTVRKELQNRMPEYIRSAYNAAEVIKKY